MTHRCATQAAKEKGLAAPRAVAWCLGSLFVLMGAARAEAPPSASPEAAPPPQRPQGRPVTDEEIDTLLRIHQTEQFKIRLVLVPTSVEDRNGRSVRGLDRADFRVFEDRVIQEIEYFDREADEPISVAFVLDVSGSMRMLEKIESAKEAIRFFVESLRPKDKFGLVAFADEQVAWITPFTSDRELFLERLAVQEGYGQTALNDAVAAAPGLVDDAEVGRKAIVLFTDGVDTGSDLSVPEAIAAARRVHVPIYTIGFTSLPEILVTKTGVDPNLDTLRRFSEETGGTLYAVNDPDDWKEAVAEISEELRFQYVIGYYPTRKTEDGKFRQILVETDRRGWVVRARNGYYAKP